MDFIKGNEQVRIDPSGIDISGVGNIIIDSNSVTGDISFNNKVNFTGDVSMNGKVSISENLDVMGDVSLNGILDMCGNVKFDDTIPLIRDDATWFGPSLRNNYNDISGGGWHLVKHSRDGDTFGGDDTNLEFNININTFVDDIYSLSNFERITPITNYDEILIYSHLDNKWWVIDYTVFNLQTDVTFNNQGVMEGIDNAIKYSHNSISSQVLAIFRQAQYFSLGTSDWIGISHVNGEGDKLFYRNVGGVESVLTRFNAGTSVFVRNSTNFKIPIPYPTLIKKESDHLHITAPLNIYPEGNELDDLGVSKAKDLKFDGNDGKPAGDMVDNSGGWYLVRQDYNMGDSLIQQKFMQLDNFHFGISYGTKETGPEYSSGHFWTRNVSKYDYDEVLFEMLDPDALDNEITKILWQIWDRTALETLMSRYDSVDVEVTGIKKSSVSDIPHTVRAHCRPNSHEEHDPQIAYGIWGQPALYGGGRWWNNWREEGAPTHRSYSVRRSDGQPVRLKNKVKVDVDGNLDVDGIITCSRLAATTTDTGTNGLTVTSEGYVGIGTSEPTCPLHVESYEANFIYGEHYDYYYEEPAYPYNAVLGWTTDSPDYTWWNDLSIRAKKNIWTEQALLESSDQRIKTDISNVNDDRALQQINRLESKEYHYIDPERRRPTKTIGFIAQEVKTVIPNAVSLQKEWIPDEMRIIADPQWENNTLTILNVDMSGNFTGKAKFYVANDPSGNDGVCKEVEIKEVHTNDSTPLFPKTKFVAEFDKPWANVFFYGKEVSDFHTIDKNKIFALHHSAIQELSRKNDSLQEEVSAKTAKITSLETRLEALETALLAMQSLVEGLH